MASLDVWTGELKVVFAIDIGTTQSAVSFLYLLPGQRPRVEHVSSWPDQPEAAERAKVLTAMFYDQSGTPRAYGGRTKMDKIVEQGEKEGWAYVHSFKRHVHQLGRPFSETTVDKANILTLPPNINIDSVYRDWLKYLFQHARSIFVSKFGNEVWQRLAPTVEVVFTVPNGWYTQEYGFLARAAVAAGIIKDDLKAAFVPETEAAVHWAMLEGKLKLDAGTKFIVCDSGGSTTDIALYSVNQRSPLKLQEIQGFPSKCIEAGSELIDDSFDDMVGHMFADKLDDEGIAKLSEDVRAEFSKAKTTFDASEDIYTFPVDVETEKNYFPDGKLEVPREDVAKHFDKEIQLIISGINELKGKNDPKHLLLLGDFGNSPYFQDQLRDEYEPGMPVIQGGKKNVKAAVSGALVWFLKHSVVARAARFAFGQRIIVPYNSHDPEHVKRGFARYPNGDFVNGGWDLVVPYGMLLKDNQERKKSYYRAYTTKDARLADFNTSVFTANETAANTQWVCDSAGKFVEGIQEICTINADISNLQGKLPMRNGPNGPYWYLEFEVAIAFGSTSPSARILWVENGKTCQGPATLIPAEFV
ncbi:hypothetical protein JAAARDRAFT_414401 [Jaapia argillacea MUCL 33604]|uniref:Uncharacterized protein n=1 Tax=Jaapia argillacea MUCL 33604 TaxID=933084 RepID=A0A067PU36_9AGAM|nr:hypothetical protein JAAARDRAFT_414401 [Jaapia argillacea MUCL 33604]